MKKTNYLTLFILLFTCSIFVAGCNATGDGEKAPSDQNNTENNGADGDFPVTIKNANRELIFEKPPERVVGLYQQEAEVFVALGLEDKLVGYSMIIEDTPEEYAEKLKDIPILSENGYPSKEVLLESDPDFVIGSERTFSSNGAGTVEEFEKLQIDAYVTESDKPETIENIVYKEIKEIAQIFGVVERGEKLIQSMQEDIDEIVEMVGDIDEPVKVMLMSGGESGSAQVSGGASLDSHLIELAGGVNIFGDENEYLLEASWEEVIERNPDVIVTSYCCGTEPGDLRKVLSNNVSLQDVTAVKNENYIASAVEDTTGNIRVVQGLRTLAEGFYPELFK